MSYSLHVSQSLVYQFAMHTAMMYSHCRLHKQKA